MSKSLEQRQQEASTTLERLFEQYQTASLATVDQQGFPQVSYAPVAVDSERNLYLFISELSAHTTNLQRKPQASLMLIEDEQQSTQLFARNRLTVSGAVKFIARDSDAWFAASKIYRRRFGKFFDQLSQLRDFHMVCLKPGTARIVIGFGSAFDIDVRNWDELTLVTNQ